MSAGSTDLQAMLATLEAAVRPDDYVYAVVEADHPAVPYDFVANWLSLTVHSSLEPRPARNVRKGGESRDTPHVRPEHTAFREILRL